MLEWSVLVRVSPRKRRILLGHIVSREDLAGRVGKWKRNGLRTVFTHGCFDLLHSGHIRVLEQARSLGDLLIVGIHSDACTNRLKGPGRPIIPEQERAEVLGALAAVDYVVVFDEPTPRELIAQVVPSVLVKGNDSGPDEMWGREEVEGSGGRAVSIPVEPGYSTSRLLDQILKLPA